MKLSFERTMASLIKILETFFSELPDEGPVITGGLQNYQLNDQLELNCTSPKSFPQTILKWYINNKTADKHTIQFSPKRGLKNGLIRTQIGLNLTVSRALFHYGKIHIKCVGIIEEGILHGYTDDDGSSHQILTILLPEQLKWERPPAEFVGNIKVLSHSFFQFRFLKSGFTFSQQIACFDSNKLETSFCNVQPCHQIVNNGILQVIVIIRPSLCFTEMMVYSIVLKIHPNK